LLGEQPNLFTLPLERLLTRDATVSAIQSVMRILTETSANVTPLTLALEPILQGYARSQSWSLSWLARRLLARANRPSPVAPNQPVLQVPEPSEEGRYIAQFADVADVLPDLANLWQPSLPTIVGERLRNLAIDNSHFEHVTRERSKLAYGREGGPLQGDVILWPRDLFAAILDDSLAGYPSA
jgi:hypothetical protein